MTGEFSLAKQVVADAIEMAEAENNMDKDAMTIALLRELLCHLEKTHSRSDLDNLIAYQLDSQDRDEFLVTRGC